MVMQLIVDFPTDRSRSRRRTVHFADTPEINIVDRLGHNDGVDRHDLWYNKSDYTSMRHANKKFILKIRAMGTAGVLIAYSGDEGYSDDCLVGAEHLLSNETIREVKTCRRRCVRAVLQEQARQSRNPTDNLSNLDDRWTYIAFASLVESMRVAVRARKIGELHHNFS
eukprot:scaffold5428_cov150-Skeletonema_menzelii.AAC.6